jgi:hypothetical protein
LVFDLNYEIIAGELASFTGSTKDGFNTVSSEEISIMLRIKIGNVSNAASAFFDSERKPVFFASCIYPWWVLNGSLL